MRVLKIAVALSVTLSMLLVASPSDAHLKSASAKGSITSTYVEGAIMTIDVKIRVTNKASKKRDIGCDFVIRRSDNDMVVGSGFGGKVIPGDSRRIIRTSIYVSDPGTTDLYVQIEHCHTYG